MMRKTTTFMFCLALVAGLFGVLPVAAAPAQTGPQAAFTGGNLVVYRVGDGVSSLVNTGNPVFLDEYTPGGTLVQSIPMPTTVSGANNQLIASGTATSEGLITLSADRQYLAVTGYARDLGGVGSLPSTTSATVPRTVGIVNAAGSVNTSTALTDYASGQSPRSAVTSDGSAIWVVGGGGGVRYATLGSTTSSSVSTTVANLRQVNIFSGQLCISTASGTSIRIGTVGTGLPTGSGETITNLPGIPSSTISPYAFELLDLSPGVPGPDTLYYADDSTTLGGINKYSLVGGVWVSNGVVNAPSLYRGVTAQIVGGDVVLFAVRNATDLVTLTDASGYNGAFSGTPTVLASAAENTAMRGVAFAPGTPLAVTLAAFEAQGGVDRVTVTWQTVSETGNAGFNLYRSSDPAGPQTLLGYVPSQAPGSTVGFVYSYVDLAVQPGETYHYWLEDVSLSGATTLHGPVSATVLTPTAVTLSGISASPAAAGPGLAWLWIAAGAGLALGLGRLRRPG